MTAEAQRIAIAEACGWWRLDATTWAPKGWVKGKDIYGKLRETTTLPDYLNDLNAMHGAALSSLPPLLWPAYLENLLTASVGLNGNMFYCYNATAAQRAEAFLRTIGKWEEGK